MSSNANEFKHQIQLSTNGFQGKNDEQLNFQMRHSVYAVGPFMWRNSIKRGVLNFNLVKGPLRSMSTEKNFPLTDFKTKRSSLQTSRSDAPSDLLVRLLREIAIEIRHFNPYPWKITTKVNENKHKIIQSTSMRKWSR